MRIKQLFCGVGLVLALLLVLTACDRDFYRGKRPIDYANSRWVCSEYGASFEVDENGNGVNQILTVNGKAVPFSWLFGSFDRSVLLKFEIDGQAYSLWGDCKFSKKLFAVYIENTKGCYKEKEITLNFVREK